jgi:hypothetical protein
LTWLVGTGRLLADLRRGRTVEEIIEADRADHEAWRRARESALLYWPDSQNTRRHHP